ncbi:EAL domain-containing protein [Hydrogenimonas thermophila]|uniref:EAL domain-containing protein n=1 Tax=Hydrogenimonas thermophila TaxID=223786 RepID=UPI002936EE01|nr:EAL domain-containing protein [Hydrogenimonas thermophila]WOE70770.1 EAL domain-containing protein [Hydrogenimonas thermophila]WOE73288.1 EAL domain-containing protein [Hydrogenimonas thermophila]
MSNQSLITIRRLVLNIIGIFLAVSLAFQFLVGYYLKKEALNSLAMEDARHTSELVFETMYTKMQEGWSKEDIEKILMRLNGLRDGMKISLFRSKIVEDKYGIIEKDHKKVMEDPLIKESMKGKEIIKLGSNNMIRYLYPIRVKKQCLTCHENARIGDINGVIDITLPANKIVVSLDKVILYFIISIAIFFLLFFIFFYAAFENRLVKPLVELSKKISKVRDKMDLDEKIHISSNCKELKTLEHSFNALIDKIKFYYEKLLDSFSIDSLTGLHNLSRLKKDLENTPPASMLLINVDRFKELNDYYGFEIGDIVLKSIANTLKKIMSDEMHLYRIGGSEFALVKFSEFTIEEITKILDKLHNMHLDVDAMEELRVKFTAGVVQNRKNRLIEKASIALNAAKKWEKPFEFYNNAKELEVDYKRHIMWMKEVESAIEDDRLIVHFQPIVKADTKKTTKYEALIRLIDKDGKIHMPGEFLDVVQNSRLYSKITNIVIQKSFKTFESAKCSFSINLSMNDIKDPVCQNSIYEALSNYPNPERVVFEILETEELCDFETVNDFISKIHSYGAKIAIDDFGSGYSNFHYLLKMKVDFYKIDGSLIRYITEDSDSKLLVESIVHFAKKLGVETVAEYVENEDIANECKKVGIEYLQGYYFGKPEEIEKICRECFEKHSEQDNDQ